MYLPDVPNKQTCLVIVMTAVKVRASFVDSERGLGSPMDTVVWWKPEKPFHQFVFAFKRMEFSYSLIGMYKFWLLFLA